MVNSKVRTKMRYSAPVGELKASPGGCIGSAPRSIYEKKRRANELLREIERIKAS